MFDRRTARGMFAAAIILAANLAQGGDHAAWPQDWNNWNDPALLVSVGNPGNVANVTDPYWPTGWGAVGYNYQIGTYEVTAAQYTYFLNRVAARDTYGLYNPLMANDPYRVGECMIQRSGTSGRYTYSVAAEYANRLVNYVSGYDCIRFVNWLQNGQQGGGTTEYGTYTISGSGPDWTVSVPSAATRSAWTTSHWVLPSEDEWYKAAYHKNDGATGN
jgi:formylglycine-generating enzyme